MLHCPLPAGVNLISGVVSGWNIFFCMDIIVTAKAPGFVSHVCLCKARLLVSLEKDYILEK